MYFIFAAELLRENDYWRRQKRESEGVRTCYHAELDIYNGADLCEGYCLPKVGYEGLGSLLFYIQFSPELSMLPEIATRGSIIMYLQD